MKKITYLTAILSCILISCESKKSTKTPDISAEKNIQNQNFSEKTLNETFTTLDGKNISFKEIIELHKGKTTVIEIWAGWCPDCIKGFETLKELQNQYPNINYVFISLDKTTYNWKQAIEKHNLQGSHYHLSQKMKDSFGTSISLDWIPRYIAINKNGEIIVHKAIAADEENLIEAIKSENP